MRKDQTRTETVIEQIYKRARRNYYDSNDDPERQSLTTHEAILEAFKAFGLGRPTNAQFNGLSDVIRRNPVTYLPHIIKFAP